MKRSNVHISNWLFNLAATTSGQCQFSIPAPSRQMKIKSITLDWFPYFTASNLRIPPMTTTTQSISLSVGGSVGNRIARAFQINSGTAPVANGYSMLFTSPGQYIFDSFYIINEVLFTLNVSNFEAALATNHNITLMIETDEEIIR